MPNSETPPPKKDGFPAPKPATTIATWYPHRDLTPEQRDTPDTRRLLELLEESLTVAERVDEHRGRVVSDTFPLRSGESRGVDLAEAVGELVQRVRGEIQGKPPDE